MKKLAVLVALANFSFISAQVPLSAGQGLLSTNKFSQTASVTVTNTLTETSVISSGIGSVVFNPNYFQPGTSLVVRAWGIHTATGNPTIRWRVKLGATVLLDSTAVTSQTSTNQALDLDGVITCRTTGVGGTFIGQGKYIEVGNALFAISSTGTVSLDTTASQTLDITVQWGTQAVGDSVTITNVVISQIFGTGN